MATEDARFGLTVLQRLTLEFIRSRIAECGVSPSYREIRDGIGVKSSSDVARVIAALVDRGHIVKMYGRARSITLVEPAHASAA